VNKFFIIGIIVIGVIVLAGATFYFSGNKSNSSATLGAETENKISHMTPTDFQKAINSGEYTLIDIRTEEEYASGHISGAAQIDFYQTQEFSAYLDSLDKSKEYLIYCRSGNRSGQALNIMQDKGFSDASDLAGGISAWIGAGLPIEK